MELTRSIDDLGLTRHVVFAGTFDTLDEVLTAADVFVSPVAASSAYPALQAMAAGVPVVAVRSGASESIITHDEHGLLMPRDHNSALVAAIAAVFSQPELARRLATAGRERATREFPLAETVRRHQALFDQLLLDPGSRTRQSSGPKSDDFGY
jgi:glycosyltransferase involved in cell wall biosynthesis